MRNRAAVIVALILYLTGCAALQSTNVPETIAVGYLTIETIADTAADSDMSQERRDRLRKVLQQAKNALDDATEVYAAGFEGQARSILSRVTELLQTAQEIVSDGRN